ncbi:MAG: YggT family protein [Chloroflexi bacterium]|nr:YggT family protein [Chloroflexota bacterium]
MTIFFIQLINLLVQGITLLVIVYSVLTFVMDPYHPVRQSLGRIVEPLLAPIRRFMPSTGMLDFSPLILLLLAQLIGRLLIGILAGL